MSEYSLYYWDVPFRGIFPQLFLEEVKAKYKCHGASEIYPKKCLKIHNPGMAPPYLFDAGTKKYLAQMPAILMHLAREYGYLPKRPENLDLALKTILDCNDVLMEFTNYFGKQMWTNVAWNDFRSKRFVTWMKVFEQTGIEHGLKEDEGYLLGSKISVADIATTALFGTIIHSFPKLKKDLEENAPRVLKLCERIEARPSIRQFLKKQRKKYGKSYCGGEIEKSLRKVIK